jgi:hypothetical protein
MCDVTFLGICMAKAPIRPEGGIFGFPDFIVSMALLVVVYNSTDAIYRFRVAVAPLPLRGLTYGSLLAAGFGSLISGLWFAQGWYAPAWGWSRAELEALLGSLISLTALIWIWYAFLRPPVFGKRTYKKFAEAVFRNIVRGSDSELPSLAVEIGRSSPQLVKFCAKRLPKLPSPYVEPKVPLPVPPVVGHDILLLLGNRKFCRHVVASAPGTAIMLMQEAGQHVGQGIPLGQFARNVTTEAILNGDSALYHEESGYTSGLLGHIQPFTRAMFGQWTLIERLGNDGPSPLDLDWRVAWSLTPDQFEAYCRITLVTFKDYIEGDHYRAHSYALHRAFDIIKDGGRDLYKLSGAPPEAFDGDIEKRFSAAVRFVDEAIKVVGAKADMKFGQLRVPRRAVGFDQTVFDQLAKLMYNLMLAAASVKSPPQQAWWIQYNAFWSPLFSFQESSPAWRVIRFKFFRLVFDEIKALAKFPNFQGARVLGMCLNVLGLSGRTGGHREDYDALTKAVLRWTRRNYLHLREVHPPVAEDVLIGGISYDEESQRLVKTYAQGLRLAPSQEFLELDAARPARVANS